MAAISGQRAALFLAPFQITSQLQATRYRFTLISTSYQAVEIFAHYLPISRPLSFRASTHTRRLSRVSLHNLSPILPLHLPISAPVAHLSLLLLLLTFRRPPAPCYTLSHSSQPVAFNYDVYFNATLHTNQLIYWTLRAMANSHLGPITGHLLVGDLNVDDVNSRVAKGKRVSSIDRSINQSTNWLITLSRIH